MLRHAMESTFFQTTLLSHLIFSCNSSKISSPNVTEKIPAKRLFLHYSKVVLIPVMWNRFCCRRCLFLQIQVGGFVDKLPEPEQVFLGPAVAQRDRNPAARESSRRFWVLNFYTIKRLCNWSNFFHESNSWVMTKGIRLSNRMQNHSPNL